MNKDIQLYIDGKPIEFNKVPDILLTYQRTDYTNPTAVKNTYSKTVTIDGTPNNNDIFNHIWKLDRIMDENFTLFNPSQRVSFELFNNGEIVEKGYAKLDSISKEGYKIAYNITLYGGLGSFFYSLAYDLNTDKEKTLADLNYMGTSDPDNEFNFEISKNRVYDAWDRIGKTGNTGSLKKWDYINFIPCYNGFPEDFDSNRVLMNTHGLRDTNVRYTANDRIINDRFPNTISDDERNYTTINGYVTGQMMRECDEWEMRDLRSYLQRPCLSVKGLIGAICDPMNNGGYNVVLDSDFFSTDNPYYDKAWITLPMLAPETDAVDEIIPWDWYKNAQYKYSHSIPTEFRWKVASVNPINGTPDAFSMDVEVHATITGTTANTLYMSCSYESQEWNPEYEEYEWITEHAYGGMAIQLYGYGNGTPWYSQSGRCGSNIIILATKVDGQYIGRETFRTYWHNIPFNGAEMVYNFGYWVRTSGNDFVWHNEDDNTNTIHIQMDSNLMSEIPNLALSFAGLKSFGGSGAQANTGGRVYDQLHYLANVIQSFDYASTLSLTQLDSSIYYQVNGKMRSYQPVRKKDLLGGLEGTPCDWLLSYCKLFGLFIEKDKVEDTIYIKMRNNWYNNETIDLDNLIDRSKEINVNPLTFETKWYNFKYGEANGKFLDRYLKDYSQDFGKQLINTQYNFDAEEIDLLEETKFRNGLTALEKSNYFNTKKDINGNTIPQCLFDWCTVTYYNYNNNNETLETNMCLPSQTSMEELNPLTPKEFYDGIPKLQFKDAEKAPTDGYGVLVFFSGKKNTGNAEYWISDDVEEMFIDGDNPCWLQTQHEWNAAWTERVAIKTTVLPEFNRYVEHNNIITAAWDFGYTKELYVPYYKYDVDRTPTMYENFWKNYIQDLYSVNTRNIDCYVALNSNNVNDFMRKFYWFDNCYWVCTKVTDFDIAIDKSTLCSFTKVNDMANYFEAPTFDDYFFNFYRINGGGNVPAQGTDEERTVYFNLDSSSPWMVFEVAGYVNINGVYQGGYVVGQEINATFAPNYDTNPRICGFVANNGEGQILTVSVWQDGYQKEKKLTLTPSSVVLPKVVDSASTISVVVDSSANWFCSTGNWVIIDTVYGYSGQTTINVSATTNNTGEIRTSQILFNNADGISTILVVKQKGNAKVTLEQNEILPVYSVPASGTGNSGVFYKIVNDIECTVEPMGNTAAYAVATGQVTYSTTIQPQSGKNFWIKVSPNNSTVSRNIAFYAYYIEDQGRYTIFPTIVPLPLVQSASGNSVVDLSYMGQGVSTELGASGMTWKATTNDSWITLMTTSGTGTDASVEYTVTANNEGYRVGYVYITYSDSLGYYCNEVIEIHQQGNGVVVITPTAITVSDRGGDYYINVESPTDFTTQISEDWVHMGLSRNGGFTVHIDQNYGYERNMNIVITTNGETHYVAITQLSPYPSTYTLDYVPTNITFDSSGGTIEVTIRSDSDWNISSGSTID